MGSLIETKLYEISLKKNSIENKNLNTRKKNEQQQKHSHIKINSQLEVILKILYCKPPNW